MWLVVVWQTVGHVSQWGLVLWDAISVSETWSVGSWSICPGKGGSPGCGRLCGTNNPPMPPGWTMNRGVVVSLKGECFMVDLIMNSISLKSVNLQVSLLAELPVRVTVSAVDRCSCFWTVHHRCWKFPEKWKYREGYYMALLHRMSNQQIQLLSRRVGTICTRYRKLMAS